MSHPPDHEAIEAAERQIKSLVDADYEAQSPRNKGYNCFAWAARDSKRIWSPPGIADFTYWPDDVPTWETVPNYERAFATEGFEVCDDGDLESGYEKIAIFASDDGTPLHAARQLPTGRWTSKLGRGIDIEHDLATLDGEEHMGKVVRFMKRRSPGPPPPPPGPLLILPDDDDPLFNWPEELF